MPSMHPSTTFGTWSRHRTLRYERNTPFLCKVGVSRVYTLTKWKSHFYRNSSINKCECCCVDTNTVVASVWLQHLKIYVYLRPETHQIWVTETKASVQEEKHYLNVSTISRSNSTNMYMQHASYKTTIISVIPTSDTILLELRLQTFFLYA